MWKKEKYMNRKFFLLVMVTLTAVSSLFASGDTVFITGSPYTKQFISSNVNTKYSSDYGFGAKAGYRYVDNGVYLGADVGYQQFKYYNKASETIAYLRNLQILVKMGGKFSISDKINFFIEFGGGLNTGLSRFATNFVNPMVAAGGLFSFRLASGLAAVAGVDVSLEWAKSKDLVYKTTQLNIVPLVGAEIDF